MNHERHGHHTLKLVFSHEDEGRGTDGIGGEVVHHAATAAACCLLPVLLPVLLSVSAVSTVNWESAVKAEVRLLSHAV